MCVLAIELIVLFAPTVTFLWERWTLSVWHNAHGALVPPVVAFLSYHELKRFKGTPGQGSAWGFVLLLPALLLHALDAGMHTQLLAAISIVMALPGLSLLLMGTARTRAIAFPLLFLVAALPIPLGMTEVIHMQLRLIAVAATSWVVPFLGIPVFTEGTTLHLSTGPLHITDACSGFSTLYAAAAVAVLTAYSTPGWRRRSLVLGMAAPLAIAANILRVVSLTALVVWTGPEVLDTFIHPLSGMLTFALALPVIFWLGGDPRPAAAAEGPA
ncbi:MAG: exosortase/archaeosortase family protein [Acidobacteria bacterium]|nr:exosortase/archaeosortase family protein [Acidobacteriota bacterium]